MTRELPRKVTQTVTDLGGFRTFFGHLTGFSPLPFQERTAELLMEGRNVVVTAPTGAGKTWAVLAPFLYAIEINSPIADRLLYALPLRSLASSLRSTLGTNSGLEPTEVRLQTGAVQEDPFFRGRVTFTTIDQLLSGYLTLPVSLINRLGNMNVGALVGASVVFDEIHLLSPEQSLGTTIELGQRLARLTQVTLMTATLPTACVDLLCSAISAAHVSFGERDLECAPHLAERDRQWSWVDAPLNVDHILAEHRGGRTLVVCNTVARAQALYREVDDRLTQEGAPTRRALLHGRFLPDDRERHEALLSSAFAKDAQLTDTIGITTQIVEAGMDWGATVLHTELAPANTLVQRAGPWARFASPRNEGRVFVYEVERTRQGRPRLGPYREQAVQVEETRNLLSSMRHRAFDVESERKLVESVHAAADAGALRYVVNNLSQRAHDIEQRAFEDGESAALSELVRDVDSVNVVVTEDPEMLELERGPRSIGVPRVSLGALQAAFAGSSVEAAAFSPQIDDEGGVKWRALLSFEEVRSVPWFLCLSSRVASYSCEVGLILGQGGRPFAVTYPERPPRLAPQYSIESWEAHAIRVAEQAEAARATWGLAAERLDRLYGLPSGTAEEALRVACLLHDFGKLSQGWQGRMQRWQEHKDRSALAELEGAPLAHTDYDPATDWSLQHQLIGRPPPHAFEGAYAATLIVRRFAGGVRADDAARSAIQRTLTTAIARHHGPRTKQFTTFIWDPVYRSMVERALGDLGTEPVVSLDARAHVNAANFRSNLIIDATRPNHATWLPLYWFLVRNLRLADQASQAARQG